MEINIITIVKSNPGSIEETKKLLTDMAIHSKKEVACVQYDLHQDRENPACFFFHEIWESGEGLALHNTQSYIQKFKSRASEILAGPVAIYKTEKIA